MKAATALVLLTVAVAPPAAAQMAISANDGKAVLVNGVNTVPAHPLPDSITILDLGRAKVVGEVLVPTSIIGPPESVAIAPDRSFALVTAATRIDPADPAKTVPNDALSVVDLKALKVVQTLRTGVGASGVSINPSGTMALVANRAEGSLSVFTVAGMTLTPAGKLAFDAKSAPSVPVFTPDGKRALLPHEAESSIMVLSVDGDTVTDSGQRISPGNHPFSIAISRDGRFAVVANMAAGGRDGGSLSLIDLSLDYPYVVDTAAVAPSPEGLALSADGRYVASSSLNGAHLAPGSPGRHDHGVVQVFRRDGMKLHLVATAPSGHWCEGMAWNARHTRLFLQCMVEKEIQIFAFDGKGLKRAGAIAIANGPAGLRVAQ